MIVSMVMANDGNWYMEVKRNPLVDLVNLRFTINLLDSMASHHAIEGYFSEIGYVVDFMRHTKENDHTTATYQSFWVVQLGWKSREHVMMDALAGHFTDLEKKIHQVKTRYYA